jgi:signal transduction histidine kinase
MGVRKDGATVDIAVKLQGMEDHTGSITSVSLIARDVTSRKNLDKKLRQILNQEQTRIGQDLHDSIGQMITGVLFKTKAIEHTLRSKSLCREADEIVDVKELLRATLLRLRELARGLIPATILSDGLIFALQRLVQDTEALCDLRIGFTADPEIEIADELVGAELYHIVEEALNNAVKHSLCHEVVIRIQHHPDELLISIRDDGSGIPKKVSQSGLGLKIMRHRAELIGAGLSVVSKKTGTEVICRVPFACIGKTR